MDHQDMGSDVRDESVLVYWFLPFSFWCLYPHLLIEQANTSMKAVERGDEMKDQRLDDERDEMMRMRWGEIELWSFQ